MGIEMKAKLHFQRCRVEMTKEEFQDITINQEPNRIVWVDSNGAETEIPDQNVGRYIESMRDQIKDIEFQNAKLIAALEFYADKNNWRPDSSYLEFVTSIDNDHEEVDGIYLGGKTARAILKELYGSE